MAILGLFNYVGGMATFAQVLLALPMTLDLLGECTPSNANARPSVLPPPLTPLHNAPFHLLHPPATPEEHPVRTTRIDPLVSLPHDLILAGPRDDLLLPISTYRLDVDVTLGAHPRQRPPIRLRYDTPMGIPSFHPAGGNQHLAGRASRGQGGERLGRRGGARGGGRMEKSGRFSPRSFGILRRARRCDNGASYYDFSDNRHSRPSPHSPLSSSARL